MLIGIREDQLKPKNSLSNQLHDLPHKTRLTVAAYLANLVLISKIYPHKLTILLQYNAKVAPKIQLRNNI